MATVVFVVLVAVVLRVIVCVHSKNNTSNFIKSSVSCVRPHPGNCHRSSPAPVGSESARQLPAENKRGSRPSQSLLWWPISVGLQDGRLTKG